MSNNVLFCPPPPKVIAVSIVDTAFLLWGADLLDQASHCLQLVKGAWSDFLEWKFLFNDASSPKISWFQISFKSVKPF